MPELQPHTWTHAHDRDVNHMEYQYFLSGYFRDQGRHPPVAPRTATRASTGIPRSWAPPARMPGQRRLVTEWSGRAWRPLTGKSSA